MKEKRVSSRTNREEEDEEGEDENHIDQNGTRTLDSVSQAASFQQNYAATVPVNQLTNGTRTTLHYPIVTEPSRRRSRHSGRSTSSAVSGGFTATMRKATQEFLGLDSDDSDQEALWAERRIRLANRLGLYI
jgi:hypothetical protein